MEGKYVFITCYLDKPVQFQKSRILLQVTVQYKDAGSYHSYLIFTCSKYKSYIPMR